MRQMHSLKVDNGSKLGEIKILFISCLHIGAYETNENIFYKMFV